MDKKQLTVLSTLLKKLIDVTHTHEETIEGVLLLENFDIENLNILQQEIELFDFEQSITIYSETLNLYLGKKIRLTIFINNISNFYSTTAHYYTSNKFLINHECFYIYEKHILILSNDDINKHFFNHNNCINIIDLFQNLECHRIEFGNSLNLLFNISKNKFLNINIDYEIEDIESLSNIDDVIAFNDELYKSHNKEDKRKIFINEVNNLTDENGNLDLTTILLNWDKVLQNYKSSYNLYLEGFSVEKIKTAANEYFLKITDKIYECISKISAYLFGIPIGFLLIINGYDLTNDDILKNFILLIVSTLFFIFIYFIFCKNIDENIKAIKDDITDFENKLGKNNELNEITEKIKKIKEINIVQQEKKLSLIKIISIIIFGLSIILFFLGLF